MSNTASLQIRLYRYYRPLRRSDEKNRGPCGPLEITNNVAFGYGVWLRGVEIESSAACSARGDPSLIRLLAMKMKL